MTVAYELDRLFGHIVNNDKIDFTNVQTLLTDRGRDEDIEFSFFELLNCLTDQHSWSIQSRSKEGCLDGIMVGLCNSDSTYLLLLFLIETFINFLFAL